MNSKSDPDLRDFIRKRIREDIAADKISNRITTRFPPEPNGYLHIGHAKSICLNFGIAKEFEGTTTLRFDDTNPLSESDEFVEAIRQDLHWLGFDWGEMTFASDYFSILYARAKFLIESGDAFVCDLSASEIRETRGSLTNPGTDSPYRDRSAEENLDLFERMRRGEFANGQRVLRAKIDMSSPNINMRDPVLYRIIHSRHHRTGDTWVIYPTYDFAHCICDSLEGITHSLCTLEFEDHRPLYDWVLEKANLNQHPPQIEFSRLRLEYTVMSKRRLAQLVEQSHVSGWHDPRMPTLAGLRKKGVPPAAIREFCRRVGVTKQENVIETELLDFCVRRELENSTPKGMAVRDPLRVVITNFEGNDVELDAIWHARNKALGTRTIRFGSCIYIDRADFSEQPLPKFKRLLLGGLVRLRYAFIIQCDEVIYDKHGEIDYLKARYFPNSRSGSDASGLKPKGVIQFIAHSNAARVEIRDYEKLFTVKRPGQDAIEEELNPQSLHVYQGLVEKAILDHPEDQFQFERIGFYHRDPTIGNESTIFHQTVPLSDGWKPS